MVEKAIGYAAKLITELMPYNYTRREFFKLYRDREAMLVELHEQVVRHIGRRDRIPDLIMDNGVPHGMHIVMFRSLDPEIRRRACEIVRFFSGTPSHLCSSRDMVRLWDEYGVGEADWLWATEDRFLDEPMGPVMCSFDGESGLEESLAALRIPRHDDDA